MTNLSKVSQDEVSKNQVIRSIVAKTQQPDAERLNNRKNHDFRYLRWSREGYCGFSTHQYRLKTHSEEV